MKLVSMEKIGGDYLKSYHITYENKEGGRKTYETVSREDNLDVNALGTKVNAVMIVPFVGDKVLMSKEFRMSVNREIYNFPAGLIDKGETIEEAAVRELKEETGLDVIRAIKTLPPSFSSIGISDEKVSVVFVEATGDLTGSDNANEEIESHLYSREELRDLVENSDNMCSRTQLISLLILYK
jgi:ADP-ribose pyrophosphatase